VAAFCEGGELGVVDGAVCDGGDGFIWCGGEFLAHFGALGASHGGVPGALCGGDGDGEVFFEGVEVFGLFNGEVGCDAGEGVFGVFVPGEEEEFEVEGCEGVADVVHGGEEEFVVGAPFAAFVGGFEVEVSVGGYAGEGAGLDFCGADGVVCGDGAEL